MLLAVLSDQPLVQSLQMLGKSSYVGASRLHISCSWNEPSKAVSNGVGNLVLRLSSNPGPLVHPTPMIK